MTTQPTDFQPIRPLRLVIHSTHDTRQRGIDGRVIPGTGETAKCDHCGKTVQIHVYVATCQPVFSEAGIVRGYQPISSSSVIGTDCAKKLGALNRTSDGCNFKWID